MIRSVPLRAALLALLVLFPPLVAPTREARASPPPPPPAATITEQLGAALPLAVRVRDHTGATVRLGELFADRRGRPVILTLMYHRCPMLCSLVLDALVKGLAGIDASVGRDLDVLSLSVDPRDEPAIAAKKREQVLARYGRPGAGDGWRFLLGDAAAIAAITRAVGFGLARDEATGEIAHPAAIVILTPEGRVSSYLYGVEFAPAELARGLRAASAGAQVATVDPIALACARLDGRASGRLPMAMRIVRVGGGAVLVALVAGLVALRSRGARRAARSVGPGARGRRSSASARRPA